MDLDKSFFSGVVKMTKSEKKTLKTTRGSPFVKLLLFNIFLPLVVNNVNKNNKSCILSNLAFFSSSHKEKPW